MLNTYKDLINSFLPNAAGKPSPDSIDLMSDDNAAGKPSPAPIDLTSDDNKDLLRKQKITLENNMNPSDVMNHLEAEGILTQNEVAEIKAVAVGENIDGRETT